MERNSEYITNLLITRKQPVEILELPELDDELVFEDVVSRLSAVGLKLKPSYKMGYYYLLLKEELYDDEKLFEKHSSLPKDCSAAAILLWFELIYKERADTTSEQSYEIDTDANNFSDNKESDTLFPKIIYEIDNTKSERPEHFTGKKILKKNFIRMYKHKFRGQKQLENRILPLLRKNNYVEYSGEYIVAGANLKCYINHDLLEKKIGERVLDYIASLSEDDD